MLDRAYEIYVDAKECAYFWKFFIEDEPDIEKAYSWFEIRLDNLTYDQVEYFKKHKGFVEQTRDDLYREVEPVNAGSSIDLIILISIYQNNML